MKAGDPTIARPMFETDDDRQSGAPRGASRGGHP
jgi:hypothetical protein